MSDVLLRVYDRWPRLDLYDPQLAAYLGVTAATLGYTDYIGFGVLGVHGCYRAYGGVSLKQP